MQIQLMLDQLSDLQKKVINIFRNLIVILFQFDKYIYDFILKQTYNDFAGRNAAGNKQCLEKEGISIAQLSLMILKLRCH